MPGIETIIDKMIKMKEYIEQLKKLRPAAYQEYINNLTCKYAAERLIQLIVDLALDINNILLSYMKKLKIPYGISNFEMLKAIPYFSYS